MKIIFIDESERNKKKRKKYFLLLGLVVEKRDSINLELELNEFKINQEMNSIKDLRTSKFDKENRMKLTDELIEILKNNNVSAISIILGPFSLGRRKFKETYKEGLDFILERFFLGLKRDNKIGMIILDSLPSKIEKELKFEIRNMLHERSVYMFGKNKGRYQDLILPTPLFIEDDHSNILQMTDILCTSLQNAVWNFVEQNQDYKLTQLKNNEDKLVNYGEYLSKYWEILEKGPNGKVAGWGIKTWR